MENEDLKEFGAFHYLSSRFRRYWVRYTMMIIGVSTSVAMLVIAFSLFFGLYFDDPDLTPFNAAVRISNNETNTLMGWLIIAAISIVLSSVCAIFNTVRSSVWESRKDIGILKSIGISNNEISKIFIYESIWISMVSWFIGFFTGLIIVNQFFHHFYMDGKGAMFFAPSQSVPGVAIISLFITAMIALIGTYNQALRASKQDPIVVIGEK